MSAKEVIQWSEPAVIGRQTGKQYEASEVGFEDEIDFIEQEHQQIWKFVSPTGLKDLVLSDEWKFHMLPKIEIVRGE